MKRKIQFIIICFLVKLTGFAAAQDAHFSATLTLVINHQTIAVEIANTDKLRRLGLSRRDSLNWRSGMLLAYRQPQTICLWMRDVSFALDAVFISKNKKVINLQRMSPHTTTAHCSTSPALYALEVNAGWAAQVKVGDLIKGLPY